MKILESQEFDDFVQNEFHMTSTYADIDEMIGWAFGEFETAVEEFERTYERKYDDPKKYLRDKYFFGFLADRFESLKNTATVEEVAEWAFGSVDEALEEFRKSRGK